MHLRITCAALPPNPHALQMPCYKESYARLGIVRQINTSKNVIDV